MIITSRKDFDGLVKTLRGKKKVFLLAMGQEEKVIDILEMASLYN